MYNCSLFDGNIYAIQINFYGFGRYPSGSSILSAGVVETSRQTRMVSSFRGADSSTYMLASGGATLTSFTRYDFDGTNPQDAPFPGNQAVESFDWVDNDTIICTDYTVKQRLYLVDVAAAPFALTTNTTWNANGYITSHASTRIRNVRVGEGEGYSGYAYYGDNGVAANPKVYALNLTNGVETELGSWNGTLRTGFTSSFGLWTVVERGGYLYLQSSDDGIQVYSMTDPTTMGSLYATYSPELLHSVTGTSPTYPPYYGFDVAPNGEGLLLGGYEGKFLSCRGGCRLHRGNGSSVGPSGPAPIPAKKKTPHTTRATLTEISTPLNSAMPLSVVSGTMTVLPARASGAVFLRSMNTACWGASAARVARPT